MVDDAGDRLSSDGLRYAVAVAGTGSFTAAARLCGVTQPALSNAIARLEERLGDRLFARSPRGVTITAFGDRILPLAERVLDELDALVAEARRLTTPREQGIRMGVSPLIGAELVARAYRAACTAPLLSTPRELVLREANMDDLQAGLRSGDLDIIVIPSVGPLPRFTHRIVASEPVVVVGTQVAADATRRADISVDISVDEALTAELILVPDACGLTRFTRQLFEGRAETVRAYPGEASGYRVLEDWATLGLGSAVLPLSRLTSPDAPHRRLVDDGQPVEIFYEAVWSPRATIARDLEALAGALSHD